MNRLVASAAAGVGAFVIVAGAFAGGYALHQPGTKTVTVTRTVTRTAPPKVITRTVTRPAPKVTVTVTATPAGGIPCYVFAGSPPVVTLVLGIGGAGGGNYASTTCTAAAVPPLSSGDFRLTTADGASTVYAPG